MSVVVDGVVAKWASLYQQGCFNVINLFLNRLSFAKPSYSYHLHKILVTFPWSNLLYATVRTDERTVTVFT